MKNILLKILKITGLTLLCLVIFQSAFSFMLCGFPLPGDDTQTMAAGMTLSLFYGCSVLLLAIIARKTNGFERL